MRIILILILLNTFSAHSFGQQVFTEEEFLSVVRKFHPIARSAGINVNIAKADLLASRGAFDPVARAGNAGKNFEGINYYEQTTAELMIPTWYGIDIYAGTETLKGSRINPEETTGSISYIGFSLPIVQNLVIDKRRAALQQSKILISASEAERRIILNDLLRDAQHGYWTWWEQYNKVLLLDSSLNNAERRLQMIRTAVKFGDRAAIDTVEAITQVQTFAAERIEALMKLQKVQLELSAYLWKENNEAYELPAAIIPQAQANVNVLLLDELLTQATNHPELQQYNFKLAALNIEKRLKFQYLLPEVDLKYNQLQKGNNILSPAKGNWFENNYVYGIKFSMPLRLSQGRGEYRKAKLKIEQTKLEQLNKQVQIATKTKQYYTEWQQTTNQILIQRNLVTNFTTLQRGEETRFFNGESSLFLINSREQKTLEARQKLVETQSKNRKALADLRWSAGLNID
jgi:outer membrane protein TolC